MHATQCVSFGDTDELKAFVAELVNEDPDRRDKTTNGKSGSRRRAYLTGLVCHLLIVIAISLREIFWFLGNGLTIVPASFGPFFRQAETSLSAALGQNLSGSNPLRQVFRGYAHLAGIEVGYGFFAPNIPDSYKVALELHYADGRVEYDLPSVGSHASGLRLAGLLDKIGQTRTERVRKVMVGMLAYAVWREHPDAIKVRAVLGATIQPTAREFADGSRGDYEVLSAYEFEFSKRARPPQP